MPLSVVTNNVLRAPKRLIDRCQTIVLQLLDIQFHGAAFLCAREHLVWN